MKIVERKYLVSFVAITTLFALWGFANDITNPMVAVFKTVMEISNAKASLVQFAFYGGYATMAIPSALFIRKYSYKSSILLGLALYALGAFLFYPSAKYQTFELFLLSLYILTFGLAFLETTANPYILSMGDEKTAIRRLNLAQGFNPFGSLFGMFVASKFVLSLLQSEKRDETGNLIFHSLSMSEKALIRANDLAIIRNPYLILGVVVVVMFILISLLPVPKQEKKSDDNFNFSLSVKRLFDNKKFVLGVIAQTFYVAVQIMCWTFIIQYAGNIGLTKATAQNYNIVAMILFLIGRFFSTYLMKFIDSARLLFLFAIGGFVMMLGTIFIGGMVGLYCLIMTSAFMSLMFPTIYGIALYGVKEDKTLGSAFLVMAIVGGALMPPLQGMLIDTKGFIGLSAVNFSFILPLFCFVIIAGFGFWILSYKREHI